MTDRQEAFVAEYLLDCNAAQAAIRAGYSAKTARWIGLQLIAKPHVARAIDALKRGRAAKTGRAALDVLRDIQRLSSRAEAEGDIKTALKGLELEAKHLGMFTQRVELSGEVSLLTQQQIDGMMEALRARLDAK